MNQKETKASYDLMRVIACLFGMAYLLTMAYGDDSKGIVVVENILISYVPLFFMLSGACLLANYDGKLVDFYKKRLLKIGIPFVATSLIILIMQIGFSVSFGFVKDFAKRFFTGGISEQLSIFYSLFVFYLIAPFLARLVGALEEKSAKQFFGLLIGYFCLFDICVIFGLKLAIVSYPFLNMFAYAIMGYLLVTFGNGKIKTKWLFVIGLCAMLVSCVEAIFFAQTNWALDTYCLTRALMCITLFSFVTGIKDMNPKLCGVLKVLRYITYFVAFVMPILMRV